MPAKKITDSITTVYRAVCTNGDYRGRWRSTKQEAIDDAKRHKEGNPNHEVEIEFEQSGRMMLTS
jgi:hypothetical protein